MIHMDPQQILQLEELCVQDEVPFCEAACPLHVQVREMLAAIANGDLVAAAALYARRVALPGILSYICDQPCLKACKRNEAGGALRIGLLERTMARLGSFAQEQEQTGPLLAMRSTSKQSKSRDSAEHTVAVVGAGLCGLTAAAELQKKGYPVTIFEAKDVAGGRLRDFPPQVLPPEALATALAWLKTSGVEVRLQVEVGVAVSLRELRQDYAAICLCLGDSPPLAETAQEPDPVTLATGIEGVFRASSGARKDAPYAPVFSALGGQRVALSADRFIKHEPLAPGREREGPRTTRLYTSLKEVTAQPPVGPQGGRTDYDLEEARAEAGRCLQCECLECAKACEYLQHFNDYPGRSIRKVTKNITSVPGKSYRTYTKVINACSLCGLCGTVCPTHLDMAVVNGQARRIMWEQGLMPPAIHDFAIRDMESANSPTYVLCRNQPGYQSSAFLFFPGCQLTAAEPDRVAQTYRLLTAALEGGVGLLTGCCGAPAAWSGRETLYLQTLDMIAGHWQSLGRPRVIMACPTCSLMFQRDLPQVETISLEEVLSDLVLARQKPSPAPPEASSTRLGSGLPAVLAIHDSCTARHNRSFQDGTRRLLAKLGYTAEELSYSRELTKCCGFGGLMDEVNHVVSGKVAAARVAESSAPYVTYCSNCRDMFRRQGKEAYHVLELLFPGGVPAPTAGGTSSLPTLSQRRTNRRRLAETLAAQLWGEKMPPLEEYQQLCVHIPPDLVEKMEAERILLEDVQRVIHQAESTGRKVYRPASGTFIAHARYSVITYWVEYAVSGSEYELRNVYSHRTQIVEEPSGRQP